MKLSGYPERYRAAIIESALTAWYKMLLDNVVGVRPLYRTNSWKKEERRKQKEWKKINWHTKAGGKVNDARCHLAADWRKNGRGWQKR